MHILFLTHYYEPEVNAPASRVSETARAWVRAGHSVTVVTCAPNHPTGILYAGFRNRWFQRELRDGVHVIRIWTFLAANKGFWRRLLNYLSYPLSLLLNLYRLPAADVVISTSPQFFCGLSGLLVQRRRRPWVLEIRDLWPKDIIALGAMKRGLLIRMLEWLERFAYRRADALVSVTNAFVPHLVGPRGGKGPIAVIKNGVDLALFSHDLAEDAGQRFRRALDLEGKFVAAYVGTHGMAHGLDVILEAAAMLRDEPDIAFLLVGDGSERERLAAAAGERRLRNVHIVGQRPKADMPAIWQATDASLVLLRRLDTYKSVLPSKMFEAMAMRRPIILGVEGEARELLDEAGAGIGIVPESAGQLAAAVRTLASDSDRARSLGAAGRRYVEQQLDRNALAARYLAFLQAVVSAAEAKADNAAAA